MTVNRFFTRTEIASFRRWTSLKRNCYVGPYSDRENKNEKLRAYSCVSPQKITKSIINADLWLLRQGLCIFIRSQNLMDFAF